MCGFNTTVNNCSVHTDTYTCLSVSRWRLGHAHPVQHHLKPLFKAGRTLRCMFLDKKQTVTWHHPNSHMTPSSLTQTDLTVGALLVFRLQSSQQYQTLALPFSQWPFDLQSPLTPLLHVLHQQSASLRLIHSRSGPWTWCLTWRPWSPPLHHVVRSWGSGREWGGALTGGWCGG